MKTFVELQMNEASSVMGGRDEQTAQLVAFIAECIGSIAKMIYVANQFRKMLFTPSAM
ncbi:MAG: hypothetical protein II202_06180 [Bacteroidales bacterium]|jgi:hypothetical protein|nr:hypothetical protein [Bacteroidales bacterium]MBQ5827410.1 hypothetical protein [Bacteroidales bacterium]